MTGNAGDATLKNQKGTVTATDIQVNLEVRDRFGRVSVTKVKRCQVTNGNGDVLLAEVDGEANVTSSFGKVDVRSVGGALAVQNTNGSVTVTGVAGRAELATSFGSLTFSEMKKEVNVVGTNATVSGRKAAGAVGLRNTYGPVDLIDIGGLIAGEKTKGRIHVPALNGSATMTTPLAATHPARSVGRG